MHGSPNVKTVDVVLNTGQVVEVHALKKEYAESLGWHNHIGAGLVAFWLYLVFLMIIGFGYSYFWSASSIIYLLMRRKVDDTELDEVHLEEEDLETPAYAAPTTQVTPAPTAPGRATVPLNVVEGPPAAPPTPSTAVVASPAPPVATPAPPSATPAAPAAARPGDGESPRGPAAPESHLPAAHPSDSSGPSTPKKTQLAPGGALDEKAGHGDDTAPGGSHSETTP
jgi:hypothetical protein